MKQKSALLWAKRAPSVVLAPSLTSLQIFSIFVVLLLTLQSTFLQQFSHWWCDNWKARKEYIHIANTVDFSHPLTTCPCPAFSSFLIVPETRRENCLVTPCTCKLEIYSYKKVIKLRGEKTVFAILNPKANDSCFRNFIQDHFWSKQDLKKSMSARVSMHAKYSKIHEILRDP